MRIMFLILRRHAMKRLFFAGLLSVFLVPHFSYAAKNVVDHVGVQQQHHRAHRSSDSKSQYTQPVDVNHADASQLMTLKGIGTKRAAQIVAYRQAHGLFKTAGDLSHVRGIGLKGLARLQANNPGRITINTGVNLK